MPIELGVMVPLGWRGELAPLGDPTAQWTHVLGLARLAEDLGLDSVWVSDHLMTVPSVDTHDSVFECWTVAGALLHATTHVRVGQLATCSGFHDPGLVAKTVACLDVMSGGRVEWGVGAGWYEGEALAYGFDFPAASARIRRLGEYVEVVRALWTEPDVTYDGEFFTLRGARSDPKPLRQPHPPVLIAGAGARHTLHVVARLADRANWGGAPDDFAATARVLAGHCAAVGRDPSEIGLTWGGELLIRDTEAELRADWQGAALQADSFESWRARSLAGTPEQVVEKMQALVAAGASAFVPWCHDYPGDQTLRRYATEVAPALRPE